jgi:hypothetical protein
MFDEFKSVDRVRGIEPWIYERTNGFESDCRHLLCESFPKYLLSATKTPRLEEQYQPKASLCVRIPAISAG